ncbi:MAG: type sorting protein [Bacteroidetes bacterium]|nr:type sorting protein [Bacteroidota bacterium]
MKKIIYSLVLLCSFSLTLPAQGWWYRKADANLSGRTAAVGFTVGTGGFVGTGFDSSSYRRNFSSYNQITDSWTQIQSMGGTTGSGLSRNAATVFVIGNKAYIGTGQGSNPYLKDLWEYDAGNDTWTQKADFGGTARRSAVGFAANSKGYITCGQDISSLKNDLWMYDPATNSWTAKAAFPGTPRRLPVAFVISNIAYVGTGDDGTFKKDFYKYDAAANTWSAIPNYGGTPRYGATAFTIGTDGYVGTGYDNTLSNRKDFWKYNSILNTWVAITDFAGSARSNAVSFAIGSYGYLATGYDTLPQKDLWRYDPLSNGVIEMDKLRSSLKVYPNPMQSAATFSFNSASLEAFSKISFMLFDISGRQLKNIEQLDAAEFTIERDRMPAGMYIYKLIADGKMVASGKLIVQ